MFNGTFYGHLCLGIMKHAVPDRLLGAGGDLGDVIDTAFGRVLGWPQNSRAMPYTCRVRQAARRLSARLGGSHE